jgi:hypothetical protein
VAAFIVILFPPLVIAFLLIMERVEEPLRRPPASPREISEFLSSATPGEVDTLASSGVRRALVRWRLRRRPRGGTANPPVV